MKEREASQLEQTAVMAGKGDRKMYLAALLCLFVGCFAPGCISGVPSSGALPPDPVNEQAGPEAARQNAAARVNGVEIGMDDLMYMMNKVAAQPGNRWTSTEQIKTKALDALILQELAYQKAVAEGLHAAPSEIDDIVGDLIERLDGEEPYRQFLASQHMTEEKFRTEAARNRAIERVITREVLSTVTIPEAELRAEYERVKEKYRAPEKLEVIDVIFSGDPGDTDLRTNAERVLKEMRKDPALDPWRLVLDGTFLVAPRDLMKNPDKELYEAAKQMKQGELSGIIRTGKGLHILKLENYRPERQMTFDELKPVLSNSLLRSYQHKRLQEWGDQLRKQAKIEILASETVVPAKTH